MPKKKKAEEPGISLFPFLSILACLSGALIVMISALSAMQAENVKGTVTKDNPLAKDYMELQSQNTELLEMVETVEQTKRYQRQLAVLEEQKVQLLGILSGSDEPNVVNAALQRAVENLIKEIEEIKLDQEVEKKLIDERKKEIAERKIDPVNLRPIHVKPAGSGVVGGKRLYVLEASAGTLILHKRTGEKVRISQGAIGLDPGYNEYLRGAALPRPDYSMMLFLVRSDGWESYRRGAGWAEQKPFNLKTVKIPIPDKGLVDLELFKKYMISMEEQLNLAARGKSKTKSKKPAPKKK
ncbi:MAG: hypothetical protein CMO80_24025 [Verrucomicrobiales bacterium]|nr:hypothetical protein [Verrucomicrobiales bacterium]|tara:strand:- start:463 stop:1353 length:891 start_codon:yes stop_codon:yes gene_type:complete